MTNFTLNQYMTQLQDILKLSISEKIQVVEAIWDSIAVEANTKNIEFNTATKTLFDERLKSHKHHPSAGSSWKDVKNRISKKI